MDDFQKECVAVFQRAAAAFNLAPSVGQIYGLLFSTPEALSLDQLIERLRASRGGTFQSLRWLREIGAVQAVTKAGERRQYFKAELNLRKLATALLNARIEPHVGSGATHLGRLRERLAPEGSDLGTFQRERYGQMERWHLFMSDVLPFIKTFAEKF